jgi:hypothetical protein
MARAIILKVEVIKRRVVKWQCPRCNCNNNRVEMGELQYVTTDTCRSCSAVKHIDVKELGDDYRT